MRTRLTLCGLTLLCCGVGAPSRGIAGSATVELRTSAAAFRGRVAAHNQDFCWLIERTGRLRHVKLPDVTSFKKVSSGFRGASMGELRDALIREYGRTFEVAGRGRYLVVAKQGRARAYAEMLDGVYRSFHRYFSVRGFQVADPEFPLVAIVFPDRGAFLEYAKQDGFNASSLVRGYYITSTNRIALYDSSVDTAARDRESILERTPIALSGFETVARKVDGGLRATVIHEATHQIGYNVGLHNRVGKDPAWIVEGLASVFEADGIRDREAASNRDVLKRVNRGRYVHHKRMSQVPQYQASLRKLIADDDLFKQRPLEAYSLSWAFSFYLIETRPLEYTRLLKRIAARDPLKEYALKQRVADVEAAFGQDLGRLQTDFERFFKQMP